MYALGAAAVTIAAALGIRSFAAVTPQHLRDSRFLLRESGSQTRELQEQVLADGELTDVPHGDVQGPEAVKQCVAAGLGITLISEHAVVDDVRSGALTVVPVHPAPRSRPVNLVRRRDRLLSPAERAFIAMLRETGSRPSELPSC